MKAKRFLVKAAVLAAASLGVVSCPIKAAFPSTTTQYVLLAAGDIGPSGFLSSLMIDQTTGALTQVSGSPVAAGINPVAIAVAPNSRFAYVADSTGSSVLAYYLNSITGVPISAVVFPPLVSNYPEYLVVDPSGAFVHVADYGAAAVEVFAINQGNGNLTQATGSPYAATAFFSLAIDSSGSYLYAVNQATNTLFAYVINSATGGITLLSSYSTGTGPFSVAVDPVVGLLYVANFTGCTISEFAINTTTGVLTSIGTASTGTGNNPAFVAVDPKGRFLYAAEGTTGSVSAFAINSSTGALTEVSGSPFPMASGADPASLAFDPNGKFLYAGSTGSPVGTIYGFAIDQTTGALSAISGSPFAIGGATSVNSVAAVTLTRPSQ